MSNKQDVELLTIANEFLMLDNKNLMEKVEQLQCKLRIIEQDISLLNHNKINYKKQEFNNTRVRTIVELNGIKLYLVRYYLSIGYIVVEVEGSFTNDERDGSEITTYMGVVCAFKDIKEYKKFLKTGEYTDIFNRYREDFKLTGPYNEIESNCYQYVENRFRKPTYKEPNAF